MIMLMDSKGQRIIVLLVIVGLVWLAFWLRLDRLDQLPPGLSNDEAVNTVDAFHFSQSGNFPLYEDPNRPEPLYRIILGLTTTLFGATVWAFRFTSVIIGTLTIPAIYQTTCECLRDLSPGIPRLAGITAAASLTVALGHITQSRIIERGTLQLPFMLFFASFLLRGLRTARTSPALGSGVREVLRNSKYFILSGLCLGICCYTYTAALVIPASIAAVGLSLLLFWRSGWRIWLPRLAILVITFAIVIAPVGLLLLDNPTAVIGRAAQVSQSGDTVNQFISFWSQFFNNGDENPQYNVASAPLLPPIFMILFPLGVAALLIRLRHSSSALIAAFLVLGAVPVIAANELSHGLRIMGEFAAFPLVIGVAVGTILAIGQLVVSRFQFSSGGQHFKTWIFYGGLIGLAVLTILDSRYAHQTYVDYWTDSGNRWQVFDRDLTHGEWFYRTDRRDLAHWIAAQSQPLLIPVDELSAATVRTWLMANYPIITTAGDDFQLPSNIRLVVPWSLELGDLRRDSRQYALLQNHIMTLLPPFSAATHDALLADIDASPAVNREGDIQLIARYKDLPTGTSVTYESRSSSGSPIAVFGDHELELVGWRGPDTLNPSGHQTLTYTLDWRGLKRLGHEYSSFLQFQTEDGRKIAGDDIRILRWLFPTTLWQTGTVISDVHPLDFSDIELSPGAYRLVAGIYVFVKPNRFIPVITGDEPLPGNTVAIGWVKVPQPQLPTIGDNAFNLDATFDSTFHLLAASITRLDDNHVDLKLYWESLVERPPVDATIFIHVANTVGDLVGQADARPWDGAYPTFIWSQNELVETSHIIELQSPADDLHFFVGMYTFPSGDRLPVLQDGNPIADNRADLGSLK
jgi:hypothetical protein